MLTVRRKIHIEFGDCDPNGIVFNPRYFAWFDAQMHALLRQGGFTIGQFIAEFGIDGLPLVENRAKFLAPSRYDEEIEIETRVAKLHRAAFDLEHKLFNKGTLAVEAYETRVWAVFDKAAGRVRAGTLPEKVVDAFSRTGA
jgi:4-hydroxybenzoyl-CoA thioesterase